MKSQMKAAGRSGARFAVIIGDDERAARTATIRDLESGEQSTVGIERVEHHIQGQVKGATDLRFTFDRSRLPESPREKESP
jgi:histidyl-tRNA synthetase